MLRNYKDNVKNYPGANSYYSKTLSIPMHTNLKNDDLKYIVNKIKTIY